MKCPPATHKYKPHGKVLICTACADVQPLLLDVPREAISQPQQDEAPAWPVDVPQPPQTIPVSDEAQMAMLRDLREMVARGGSPSPEQMDLLGTRHPYTGDFGEDELLNRSNTAEWPKVPVMEGYETDPRDDNLPSAGL